MILSKKISTALLTCFFAQCEKQFSFLQEEQDFKPIYGTAVMKKGRQIIMPYRADDIDVPFYSVARFERGERAFEITYGGLECVLELW